MFNADLLTEFRQAEGGLVELRVLKSGREGYEEVARYGFTPADLQQLLTEGQIALWDAMGVAA